MSYPFLSVDRDLNTCPPGDTLIECHVREVENLPDAFALVVQDGKFLVAVRRGLVPRKDVDLLDRLLKRGLSELLQMPNLALTS